MRVQVRSTDYYLYRLETPWKRKITAPQAAVTSLSSRHSVVRKIIADPGYEYGRSCGGEVSEGTERIAVAFVSDFCS